MKNIVILGGSFGGVSTAHRILKQAAKTGPVKITLVSPTSHFYWSLAAPRAIIPGQIADDEIFHPTAVGFSQYPSSQFEFILASAESLDFASKTVEVSGPTGQRTLDYDILILATGSHIDGDAPFKARGSTEETKAALHDFQDRVAKAKTIVVAGAGATGVEVSGELGFEYGRQKEIVLLASGPTILERSPASVANYAMNELRNLNVALRLQERVKGSATLPDGRQELTLSAGDKLVADMYIPTFGLVPNSSYIPAKFLNADGCVMVNEYLQVKGAADVWALGDVCDAQSPQYVWCDRQSAYIAKSITLVLRGKTVLPYKPLAGGHSMGIQIGKKAGTGHYGTVKVPSFMIIWARKRLFIDKLAHVVDGSAF